MAVKIGDKELRFGLREPRALLPPQHEVRGLPEIPRPLRFVENDDVIDGCVLVPQPVIPKVMHILDERLHGLPHDSPPRVIAPSTKACDFVTRQRLPKYGNQGAVTGEEHSVGGLRFIALLGGHIEADQRLASARYASDKHNDLVSTLPRVK
jgi:hypothetical protein